MRPRQKGASQFSNATPRGSPSRQISRHLWILRKLSKDNSKFGGRTGKIFQANACADTCDICNVTRSHAILSAKKQL
jgi:hypothetical protein